MARLTWVIAAVKQERLAITMVPKQFALFRFISIHVILNL